MNGTSPAEIRRAPTRPRACLARSLAWLGAATLAGLAMGCETLAFERLPDAEVDAARKGQAEKFASTVLGAWARDEYPTLGEEATEEMRTGHDAEAQKKADKQLEAEIGSFKSLAFAEVQRSKPPKFDVYRFKGTFDKSPSEVEVRVVHDADGKVSAFWVRPWKDAL